MVAGRQVRGHDPAVIPLDVRGVTEGASMQRVSHGSSGLRMGPSLTGARRRSPGRAGHHRRLAAVGGLTPDLSRKVPAIGARIRLRQTEGSGSIGRQAGGPGDGSTVPFASATVLVPASLGLREPDRPLVAPNVSLASGRAGCLFPASLPRHLVRPEARTTRPPRPGGGRQRYLVRTVRSGYASRACEAVPPRPARPSAQTPAATKA